MFFGLTLCFIPKTRAIILQISIYLFIYVLKVSCALKKLLDDRHITRQKLLFSKNHNLPQGYTKIQIKKKQKTFSMTVSISSSDIKTRQTKAELLNHNLIGKIKYKKK